MTVAFRSLLPRLRSRTGWIGIDIGTQNVKLAQLELVDGVKRLADAVVLPCPDGTQLTAESLRTGWLAGLLRGVLPRFRGRTAACGVSMSVTDFRSLNIPPGTLAERRDMIAQELSESGLAAETLEFDFWDSVGKDHSSAVNVLAMSEALAAQLAEAMQNARLNCPVLDGGPFTLARAVNLMRAHVAVGQTCAVLDWGHRVAHLAVIVNGQPAFSRILKDCEVGPLVQLVSKGVGLSLVDTHELLSTYGIPDPNLPRSAHNEIQELVADIAADTFEQLNAELEKTLQYLDNHRVELIPSELILLGGGATIRHAEAKLATDLRLPVTRWQLPLRPTVGATLEGRPLELFAHAAALSELGWES